MGANQKYYDVDEFNRWKRNKGKANKIAPRPNLLAAANWVRKFFDARKTNWAALGSLAMLCLGTRKRDTGYPYCSHGTPPSDVLRNNQVMLTLNLEGKATNIKGLNVLYLVKSTVHLCNSQDLLWDPKKDLLWFCRKFGKEIESIRGQLNARQVQENFLGTKYFSTLSAEEQRLCYHILLGKVPPPSMFLTPAPHQGHLTSAAARPPIPSHKSAPSLRDNIQQESGFLRPPIPSKSKTTNGAPSNAFTTETQIALADLPRQNLTSEAARDSRSRYRHSSAPTTPNGSRNTSPEAGAHPLKASVRSEHSQPNGRIYQAQSVNLQNVAHSSKPQVVSHGLVSISNKQTGVRSQKSLPRLNDTSMSAVPVFAHKPANNLTAPKAKNHSTLALPTMNSEPNMSPRDQSLKAQNNNSALALASGNQPQVVACTHPAHKIIAAHTSMIQPDRSSVAPTSVLPEVGGAKNEISSKGLAVVGPEGLYPTPLKTTAQPAKSETTLPISQKQTGDVLPGFVFELDATSPQVEPPSRPAPTTPFIAELPADNNGPPQPIKATNQQVHTLPETPISPPQVPMSLASTPMYRDSPVSPPTTYRPFASIIQPLNPELKGQPLKPELTPPSFDSLPPSLMIGFRGAPHHSTTSTASRARASSQSSNSSTSTKKYQRYYSPPNSREPSPNHVSTSTPTSQQLSSKQGPVITYKAYTPPITPPMQPMQSANTPEGLQQLPPMPQRQAPIPPMPQAQPPMPPMPQYQAPIPPMPTAAPSQSVSAPVGRVSPPNILRAGGGVPQPLNIKAFHLPNPLTANPPTPRATFHAKHDSHQKPQEPQYMAFTVQKPQIQPARRTQTPFHPQTTHQRSLSNESNTSTTSHDSEKLAQEYQMDLPAYGNGYGAKSKEPDAHFKLDLPDFGKSKQPQGSFMDEYDFT
ncbi:hypothetical protein N0V90_003687 [Kalmusia sp. IMI 367209]|nr:hypothetical protein N0V90_003687 [Kalmusia sp. IMI 367209]